jgi:hypothetical protein
MENKVDKLLAVLDEDIRYIHDSLLQLNELRSSVVKRDDAALDRLLSTIRAKAGSYVVNESKRQSLRKDLADALGCNVEQMTLTMLESRLPIEKKAQVANKKAELRTLIGELKREHLATATLLSECARFNNLLLASIFDLGKTGTLTYRANGVTNRQMDKTLVNLHI